MKIVAPMLIPVLGVTAGIMCARHGATVIIGALVMLSALGLYYILSRFQSNPVKNFTYGRYHILWVFMLFTGIGIFTADLQRPWESERDEKVYIYAQGEILDIDNLTSGDRLLLDVDWIVDSIGKVDYPSNLRLLVNTDAIIAGIGDVVQMPISLQRIEDPSNFFADGYAERMASKGIFYRSSVIGGSVSFVKHNYSPRSVAAQIRNNLESIIENAHLDRSTSSFLITILLGDRAYLGAAQRNLFADAGISHMLALSGMHVAMIAGIVMVLLFPMNFFGMWRYRLLISVILLFGYAFITGFAPSTVRAVLMMTSTVICIFLERKNSAWNSLLFAVFIILILSPMSLFDTGLQLSFLCVASLILFSSQLNPVDRHDHPVVHKVFAVVSATLTVTLATWVLSAYYFGQVPVWFLPANIVVLPLLPLYLTVAIAYLLLSAIGAEFVSVRYLLDFSLEYLNRSLEWLTDQGTSAISYSPRPVSVLLWLTMISLAAIWLHNRNYKWIPYVCGVLATLFCITVPLDNRTSSGYGLIIQSGGGPVSMLAKTNDGEQALKFRPCRNYLARVGGRTIIVNDAETNLNTATPIACDMLIVSSHGIRDVGKLLELYPTRLIIVHTGIKRKEETELIEAAERYGVRCHSLRNNGPLRISLSD